MASNGGKSRPRRAASVSPAARYGTSYIIGKIEIEKLLFERKQQLGERFTIKRFMDEFDAAGLVPAALIRWELTGRKSEELRRMLD